MKKPIPTHLKIQDQRKTFGFWRFAWLPIQLTSGEFVWLRRVFFAGEKFGCQNRYSVGHRKYELKYSDGPIETKKS